MSERARDRKTERRLNRLIDSKWGYIARLWIYFVFFCVFFCCWLVGWLFFCLTWIPFAMQIHNESHAPTRQSFVLLCFMFNYPVIDGCHFLQIYLQKEMWKYLLLIYISPKCLRMQAPKRIRVIYKIKFYIVIYREKEKNMYKISTCVFFLTKKTLVILQGGWGGTESWNLHENQDEKTRNQEKEEVNFNWKTKTKIDKLSYVNVKTSWYETWQRLLTFRLSLQLLSYSMLETKKKSTQLNVRCFRWARLKVPFFISFFVHIFFYIYGIFFKTKKKLIQTLLSTQL